MCYLSSVKQEINTDYNGVLERMREAFPMDDPEHFSLFVMHKINGVLEELITSACPNISRENLHKIVFLYQHYDFIEHHLIWLVESREGGCCWADKTRWLLRAYQKYLQDGEAPNMMIGEKCYWKPEFGTGEQWIGYIDGIHRLYYGKPNEYLESLKSFF